MKFTPILFAHILVIILCFHEKVFAQSPVTLSEAAIETQAELQNNSEGDEVIDPGQDYFLNLNTSDVTELLSSPLFTPEQSQAVIVHRQRFGLLLAVEELQVCGVFDTAQLQKMKPFLFCGRPVVDEQFSFSALLASARHEVLMRFRRRLQDKKGFSSDGNYPFYLGDPNQYMFRYRMRAGNYFSAGIVMEKDPGEVMFAPSKGGRMDFFSWHVFLRPNRFIRTLYFGDYQFQFGQGLVAWNGLSLGKSPEVSQFYRRGMGFRPYASSGESGFNRGVATSLSVANWTLDVWGSYRKLDASLFSADTSFQKFEVSSILQSGLHRTYDEIRKSAVVTHLSSGVHVQWDKKRMRAEWTLHQQYFEYPLWGGDDPYEKFDARGKRFVNMGGTLRYLFNNATAYSEIAVDKNQHRASLFGLLIMPDPRWTLSLHVRDYPKEYQCLGCDALREGSQTQNEKGILVGFSWQLHHQFRIQGYLDQFTFPWLRYTSSAPSNGKEWLTQFTFTPNRTTEAYVRIKQEVKAEDVLYNGYELPKKTTKLNIRTNINWMYTKNWEFQARCEWVGLRQFEGKSAGILFYQEVRYKPLGKPFSVAIRWSMFHTDAYDTRIYSYEQDMAGSFSLPAYAANGSKYYLLGRYRITKGVDLWLRYSRSVFLQTATEQDVEAEPVEEFKAQVRWQF